MRIKDSIKKWLGLVPKVMNYVLVYSPEKHATKLYYLKGPKRNWKPLLNSGHEVGFYAKVINRDNQVRAFRADRVVSLSRFNA
jgi:hypothetical protein